VLITIIIFDSCYRRNWISDSRIRYKLVCFNSLLFRAALFSHFDHATTSIGNHFLFDGAGNENLRLPQGCAVCSAARKTNGEIEVLMSTRKTTTMLATVVFGLGVLGAAAPSYADNNGSLASPPFPSNGAVRLGAGIPNSYSAYYPSIPPHSTFCLSTGSNYGSYLTDRAQADRC
jgi:hypothetical protein